ALQKPLPRLAFAPGGLRVATQTVAPLGLFGIKDLHDLFFIKKFRRDDLAFQQFDDLAILSVDLVLGRQARVQTLEARRPASSRSGSGELQQSSRLAWG